MATAATTFAHQRKKERLERQNVILGAAERVYGRKPFETVSMRDIANEAGIAVSSLYRYFPDQQPASSLRKRQKFWTAHPYLLYRSRSGSHPPSLRSTYLTGAVKLPAPETEKRCAPHRT